MVTGNEHEPDFSDRVSAGQAVEQQELHEGDERYRALFEQAGVGMAHVSRDGKWLQVNQKLCDVLGYSKKDLLARSVQDSIYLEDYAPLLESLQSLLQGEQQTYTLENRYIHKDGTLVWMHQAISVGRDAEGKPDYFIFILEDIGERKREEAEAQERIEALREANQRMEEFLGVASHELRTPLTTIKANIQLAMRRLKSLSTKVTSEQQEVNSKLNASQDMLTRAERQIGVLNRLVGDMIDISRIQAGKLQVHLLQKPCDLVSMVQDSVQEQRKATPGRSILVEVPEGESIPVRVDPDRIGQVLTNYISNAMKYSETERPILIRLERVEGNFARVSVKDEGQGLSSEDQKRVWECFYQAPDIKVVSGSGVGLGLGLYISQTIVARHGGQVGVESVLDKGSTFWFTLPIEQQDVGE